MSSLEEAADKKSDRCVHLNPLVDSSGKEVEEEMDGNASYGYEPMWHRLDRQGFIADTMLSISTGKMQSASNLMRTWQ